MNPGYAKLKIKGMRLKVYGIKCKTKSQAHYMPFNLTPGGNLGLPNYRKISKGYGNYAY
jgi:hypothetical protein